MRRKVKAASDVDYPAYGVTGPTKERLPSPGDRKLAQSAQMANGEMKHDASEDESEEENEEGDYTVYECPGLAPTGEMEVRNPLFTGDAQTPVNGETPANLPHPPQQQEE
ncbi:NPDC1-like protein [Mya arenaria]|uniref:NPDC1-like protein n=1 Tax=Mya arenaria TaxID=6604 RepID=A0ABY7GB83_MYAAR|nr:NPDC1-like protein [Mya arenaria]